MGWAPPCIPPEANADFVCAMEDVLEVYQRPHSKTHPLVCIDEATKQLVKETRLPCLKELVDGHFPEAEKIPLVTDNLNTHKPASLYEAFPPEEARRILEKIEWHYTPKPGSWLDMAEIELSVLQRQCLDRRIPDQETLKQEVQAWENERNRKTVQVDWRFTTQDARIKLKRLYPSN